MATAPEAQLTEQEYLQRERAAEFSSEFYRGEMFVMAGVSRNHSMIAGNLLTHLKNLLRDHD